jgi:hypothetical protein
LAKVISPLLIGSLKKYRGIEAAQIAKGMQVLANKDLKGVHFIESDELAEL